MDTIFAVSSGAPPAAIAVLRLSGPDAVSAATALAGPLPEPRIAAVRALRDPADGELLDRALVLRFAAPDTATGEDVVELHLHGGRAVVRGVERVLAAQPGLRKAEPGEFTRRALMAGRIDLTEAEGLGDLLAAETEGQRRAALATAEGAVRRLVAGWAMRLTDVAAEIEANIDFSDEDDVIVSGRGETIAIRIAALAEELDAAVRAPPVERLRNGLRVAIGGPPNSGKSSLFNKLVDREAAIVSPISGTTRDRIEAAIVRDGIAYLLIDTAGLAARTDDAIERIGIARAVEAIDEADVLLWLGAEPPPREDAILIHARADLPGRAALLIQCAVPVSAKSGLGLDTLWQVLARRAQALLPPPDATAINARHREALSSCRDRLCECATTIDPILMAEGLRMARRALDTITGHVGVEPMLDALFGKFCLGK